MSAMDEVVAKVQPIGDVLDSSTALLNGIYGALETIPNPSPELIALKTDIANNTPNLAAAVPANTPCSSTFVAAKTLEVKEEEAPTPTPTPKFK